MPLTISPIGSCRIVDPLRRARSVYGFEMNRGRTTGFTHSSPEAVQQLRFLRGEIDIPDDLWPYISSKDRDEVRSQTFEEPDIYIVELSSTKVLLMGGYCLQLNYLRTQFEAFFKDNSRKNAYWKAIRQLGQEDIDSLLAQSWSGTPGKDADSAILRQIRLSNADAEQTRADIRYLRDTLPVVLFVTHVNAVDESGERIKTRDDYVEMVKSIAAEEGCAVYDPTDSMVEMGQDVALESDLNHFNDPFKERVVADWYEQFIHGAIERIVLQRGPKAITDILLPYAAATQAANKTAAMERLRTWCSENEVILPALSEVYKLLPA